MSDDYNDGYTHEVWHTVHVLLDMFDRHVVETRCADQFPEVKLAAARVEQALHELVGVIGANFLEGEDGDEGH